MRIPEEKLIEILEQANLYYSERLYKLLMTYQERVSAQPNSIVNQQDWNEC